MDITPGEAKRFLVWGRFSPTARGTIQFFKKNAGTSFVSEGVRVERTFAEFYIPGDLLQASDLPLTVRLIVNGTTYRTITFESASAVSEPPTGTPADGGGSIYDPTVFFDNEGNPDMETVLSDFPTFTLSSGNNPVITNGLTGEPGANLFDYDAGTRMVTFRGKTGLYLLQRNIAERGGATNFSNNFELSPIVRATPLNVTLGGGNTFSAHSDVITLVNGAKYSTVVMADVANDEFVLNFNFTPLVLN